MVLGPDNPNSSVKALFFIVVLHQIKHVLSLKICYCSFCKEQMFKKPACPGDETILYDVAETAALCISLSLLQSVNLCMLNNI